MNSSLSDFLSAPPAHGGAPHAARAGLLPNASPAASDGTTPAPADFSDLMTEASQAVPTASAPTVITRVAPVAVSDGPLPSNPAGEGTMTGRSLLTVAATTTEAARPLEPVLTDPVTPAPTEVSEATREQAVAFAMMLMQTLLPEAMPAPETPSAPTPGAAFHLPAGAAGGRDAGASPMSTPTMAPEQAAFDLRQAEASAPVAPALPGQTAGTTSAAVSHAADGGVTVAMALPKAGPSSATPARDPEAAPSDESQAMTIDAELVVTGQPVVRVQATGYASPAPETAAPAGRSENFAGKSGASGEALAEEIPAAERNFENTAGQRFKARPSTDGIGVAQGEVTMSAAPTEEIRAVRQPQDSTILPGRVDFQVAQVPVERITTPVPEPAGQTFSERAVETVTRLAEAQFAVSMQRSGSVQLRLQFGGEDLSVRVAIRDGAVQTDFRTDSATLRAALEQEWQAVKAASPEHLQRFAEPVFGPAATAESRSGSGQGDGSPSHARSQQSPADPDAQSQHQRPAREQAATAFFSRRSLVPESFVPEPAAPRAAAFLPTSLRLSALA